MKYIWLWSVTQKDWIKVHEEEMTYGEALAWLYEHQAIAFSENRWNIRIWKDKPFPMSLHSMKAFQ